MGKNQSLPQDGIFNEACAAEYQIKGRFRLSCYNNVWHLDPMNRMLPPGAMAAN